jgi:hypothetical protein
MSNNPKTNGALNQQATLKACKVVRNLLHPRIKQEAVQQLDAKGPDGKSREDDPLPQRAVGYTIM